MHTNRASFSSDDEDDRKPAAVDKNAKEPDAHHHFQTVKPVLIKKSKKKNSGSGATRERRHLQWDEQAIEEHDALRGTRMKIDEPNTPYTYYDSGAESDDSRRPKSPANQKHTLSWDILQNRLDSVAAVREQFVSSSPESLSHGGDDSGGGGGGGDGSSGSGGGGAGNSSDVEPEHERRTKEMRNLEFKELRKRHYNEMEAVKKFRQEHPDVVDVVDADDEENGSDAYSDGMDGSNVEEDHGGGDGSISKN